MPALSDDLRQRIAAALGGLGPQIAIVSIVLPLLAIDLIIGNALQQQARNDRNWKPEHTRLADVEFDGNMVTLKGVRHFTYHKDASIRDPLYETRSYDLADLRGLWFGVQPFLADILGHSFLSFEFNDGTYLVLSVEARQEVGEDYSVTGGLMRQFELIYVWSDERDVIGLRSHILKDDVYLYEIQAPLETIKTYLISQLKRTQELSETPDFYNTITQNCTTSLFEMSDVPALKRYSDYRVLFPGYAHRLLHELGAIDTSKSAEVVREKARIDAEVTDITDGLFSRRIRGK